MPLTIANWNVRNFYNDVFDDPVAQFEDTDNQWDAHRADVGNVLGALDADIVVLSEVEHADVVNELNDMELAGAYEHIAVIDGNDPRGIDVGVMSKIPLDEVISHKDDSFKKEGTQAPNYIYSRDALELHLTFNGRPMVIFAVHYKAKEMDNPDKRLAEAQHTRALADAITAAAPNTAIMIAGDFNDLPASPPYQATVGTTETYGNAAELVPMGDRWTFDFMNMLELVDHQFSNPLLNGMLNASSVMILHGPEVEAASDHSPVIATYNVF